jgi:hypothetical protein
MRLPFVFQSLFAIRVRDKLPGGKWLTLFLSFLGLMGIFRVPRTHWTVETAILYTYYVGFHFVQYHIGLKRFNIIRPRTYPFFEDNISYSLIATLRSAISWNNWTNKNLTKNISENFPWNIFFKYFLAIMVPRPIWSMPAKIWGSRPAGLGGDRERTNIKKITAKKVI